MFASLQGVPSPRWIEKKCREEVAYRASTANPMPDRCTIARFRARMRNKLQDLFGEIRCLCRESGWMDLRPMAINGTKNSQRLAGRQADAGGEQS